MKQSTAAIVSATGKDSPFPPLSSGELGLVPFEEELPFIIQPVYSL